MVYKKVRTGCDTCKTRKIKCDEKRPSCERCTKAGWVCPYSLASLPSKDRYLSQGRSTFKLVRNQISRYEQHDTTMISISRSLSESINPLNRHLLHHFYTILSPGLRLDAKGSPWNVEIPLAATSIPVLQDAFLTAAAADLFRRTCVPQYEIEALQAKASLLRNLQHIPYENSFILSISAICLAEADASLQEDWSIHIRNMVTFGDQSINTHLEIPTDLALVPDTERGQRLRALRSRTLQKLTSKVDTVRNAEDADRVQDQLFVWYSLNETRDSSYYLSVLKLAARWQPMGTRLSPLQRAHYERYLAAEHGPYDQDKQDILEKIETML